MPKGKVALGKMAAALVHGARVLEVDGNFDDVPRGRPRSRCERYPVTLVNSVNPFRLQGQKTCAFEIVDPLGRAPDVHCLPVGNAGNISSHWIGYQEYLADGVIHETPRLFGYQAAGAAPLVRGEPVADPQTIATAIRIGNPASWDLAVDAARASEGGIWSVTDRQILAAYRRVAHEGLFVEPASAASVAGLLQAHAEGKLDARVARRLRADRARPEGRGVGDRRRRASGHRRGRRRRGGERARSVAGVGSAASCARPSPCPPPPRTSGPGSTSSGSRSTS